MKINPLDWFKGAAVFVLTGGAKSLGLDAAKALLRQNAGEPIEIKFGRSRTVGDMIKDLPVLKPFTTDGAVAVKCLDQPIGSDEGMEIRQVMFVVKQPRRHG